MSRKLQVLFVVLLVGGAVAVTLMQGGNENAKGVSNGTSTKPNPNDGTISASGQQPESRTLPKRKWDVLDPKVDAEAVAIQSLDSGFPFLNYQTYKTWPMASLTKLMTAVVVAEEMGMKKKVQVSQTAIDTEGLAGDFKSGEVYTSEDLLKILLLTSSNDAASAFEEAMGGREAFVHLLNNKAEKLGMTQTIMHDAAGLSDLNQSSASDLMKLARYLIEKHPDIVGWTRLQSFIVQPANDTVVRSVYNINTLTAEARFLGGKTGTSPEARQNLLAFLSFGNERVAFIMLGSSDRVKETDKLIDWIRSAYIFD